MDKPMAPGASGYTRLTRRTAVFPGTGRLWMGGDHILQVFSSACMERYRRYYLRDIEALIIRRTRVGVIVNVVLGTLAVLSAGAAGGCFWGRNYVQESDGNTLLLVLAISGGFLAGLSLLALLVNVVLGPTCACYLKTCEGAEALSLPTRLGPARRLAHRLAVRFVANEERP